VNFTNYVKEISNYPQKKAESKIATFFLMVSEII